MRNGKDESWVSKDLGITFEAVDAMIGEVRRFRLDPQFTAEVDRRRNRGPDFTLNDNQILGRLIALIAFSNNANSKKVGELLQRQVFERIFYDYSVDRAAALSVKEVVDTYWQDISAIRFKKKVDAMVRCAKCLREVQNRHGSFMKFLSSFGLPTTVKSPSDIRAFWSAFDRVRKETRKIDLPYFTNFISLCHLLMDLDFDVAKPDLAVMKASVSLRIVPQSKTPMHPEQSLRKTVEIIQAYAVTRGVRVPVIDFYFLVKGGQFWAREFVKGDFYQS